MPPTGIISPREEQSDPGMNNRSDVIKQNNVYQAIDFSEMPRCRSSLHRVTILNTLQSNRKVEYLIDAVASYIG